MVTKTSHLPIRYFLALLWAHPILHVRRIRVNYECTDRYITCVLAGWEDWRWYFLSVYWHGSTWLTQPLDQILLRPMKRITVILQVDVTVWSTGLVSWGTGHVGMWRDRRMLCSFPSLRLFLWSYGTCRRFEVATALMLRTLVWSSGLCWVAALLIPNVAKESVAFTLVGES